MGAHIVKDRFLAITRVVSILILLAVVVMQVSYSAASHQTSSAAGNKLTRASVPPQAQGFTTEPQEASPEDVNVYTYDELGRLVQVEYPDGGIITYTYDAVGNRVSTEVSLAWPAWDVNMDGNINMLDVIGVGNHWGESGEPGWIREDVNSDGMINMLDVIMIGNHWGE